MLREQYLYINLELISQHHKYILIVFSHVWKEVLIIIPDL